MIYRIIYYATFFYLMLALMFALQGIYHVELSKPFLSFVYATSKELDSFSIAIPNIPDIPKIDNVGDGEWYEFIINALNGIISFLNGLVVVLNFLIMVLNTIIKVIAFIFVFIKNIIVMRDTVVNSTQVAQNIVAF